MTTETIVQAEAIAQDRDEQFILLARRIALGEEFEPLALADMLRGLGRTADELKSLAGQFEHRQALREKIAAAQASQSRRDALQSQITAANQTLDDAVAVHQRETRRLQEQLAEINNDQVTLCTLPNDLLRSCPSKEMQRRLELLKSQQAGLAQQVQADRQQLNVVLANRRTATTAEEVSDWQRRRERAELLVADGAESVEKLGREITALVEAMREF